MMDVHVTVGEFNAALWKRFHEGKIRNVYPLAKYNDIVKKIKSIADNPPCNTPGEYYLLRKFIVVKVAGKERLSCKSENNVNQDKSQDANSSKVKFYVALEEIYNYIDDAHRSMKHGGRDRIVRNLQNQGIVNITRDTVELFLSYCKICRPRKKDGSRKIPRNSLSPSLQNETSRDSPLNITNENENNEEITAVTKSANETIKIELDQNSYGTICSFTRGYMDLLDFSNTPDGDYRFVFLYIDIQTCFCVLHPLKCKCTHEIVSHLLNVFTLIGPPQVLHSNFEERLLFSIIKELKNAWPEVIIVVGSPNYVELQEVARNCVTDIEAMIKQWMLDNKSRNWSLGLKFTQLRKNTKLVTGNSKSPYECFFVRSLNNRNMPTTVDASLLSQAEKEDDLLSLINQQKEAESNTYENLQVSVDPNICALVQNNAQNIPSPLTENEEIINSSTIKTEPFSDDEDQPIENGMSDSSNDTNSLPTLGNFEIVIKQETSDNST